MTPLGDRLGWVLLHFLWQGTAITIAAAVALYVLRLASARTRYTAGCITLLALTFVPVITLAVLAIPRRVAGPDAPQRVVIRMEVPREMEPVLPEMPPLTSREATERLSVPATLRDALVIAWLGGVAFLSVRLFGGLWRVARVYRAAAALPDSQWTAVARRIGARLGVRSTVRVVDADFVDTPTLLGRRAPIIVLPAAATARLTAPQVEAILAHELAHVRRHDYIVNTLQAACEALLCHHPGVWWLSRRIRAEREHCCDDLAVAYSNDRLGYATALAELETLRTAQPELALAVTGGALLPRIRYVLAPAPREGHRSTVAVVAALLTVIVAAAGATEYQASIGALAGITFAPSERVVMMRALHLRDASLPAQRVSASASFEAASVKPSVSTDDGTRLFQALPGGRVNIVNYPLREVIRIAYQLQPYQLVEGADWLASERFDIAATPAGNPAPPEMLVMLRNLLADRFGLILRTEARDMPVYLLVPARTDARLGDRLRPAAIDCSARAGIALANGTAGPAATFHPKCGFRVGVGSMSGGGVDMDTIARRLSMAAGRPVIDRTMLAGRFDFDLTFAPDPLVPGDAPPIFAAIQEQLGLRLQADRRPVDVRVIEKVQRPTPD